MNCETKEIVDTYTLNSGYDVRFIAYAPLHTFKGWTCQGVEAEMEINFHSGLLTHARAVAQTRHFDTGFDDRNRAMFEYMQVDKYPEASVEMIEQTGFSRLDESRYQVSVQAALEFIGARRRLPLNFMITRNGSGFSIDLDFKWSFRAYGLKAPRLLFLTVRDIVDISGKGEFARTPSADPIP